MERPAAGVLKKGERIQPLLNQIRDHFSHVIARNQGYRRCVEIMPALGVSVLLLRVSSSRSYTTIGSLDWIAYRRLHMCEPPPFSVGEILRVEGSENTRSPMLSSYILPS